MPAVTVRPPTPADAEAVLAVILARDHYVDALAVAPRGRGRGHGRTLLLGAFAAFRAAGQRIAELSVHAANLNAARLYESAGMTVDTRTDRWEKVLGDA